MKCPIDKCEGNYRTISTYDAKNVIRKRRRKCDKCGFEDYTIEVSAKDHERMRRLALAVKLGIKEYMS